MSKKEDEAVEQWLSELKTQFPDAAAQLDSLAGTEAGKELYRGKVVREKDYYRRLNEQNEEQKKFDQQKKEFETLVQSQNQWFQGAKPEYDRAVARAKEADELRKRLGEYESKLKEMGVTQTVVTPPASHREEDDITARELQALRDQVRTMDQSFPIVMAQFLDAQSRAIKEGYDVAPGDILKTVYADKVTPQAAFEKLTAEERSRRAAAEMQKKLNEAKEEGRREAMSKLQGPERIPLGGPSIVEALRSKEGAAGILNKQERIDAAVADFLELQSNS